MPSSSPPHTTTTQARLGIPAHEQLLTVGGRALLAPHPPPLAAGATVDLCLRLRGGKGGFGALLRGQGRDGKITDNYDACRDLTGRRLRTVEAEKKLKEWAAQAKERELEKVAERHIRDLARQQRRERDYEVNVEAVRGEQRAALERVHEAVQSALAEGLLAEGGGASGSGKQQQQQKGGASGSGAGAGGSSSSDTAEERAGGGSGASPVGGGKRKAEAAAEGEAGGSGAPGTAAAAAAAPPGGAKRQKRGGMLDMLEGSDDDDDSDSHDE